MSELGDQVTIMVIVALPADRAPTEAEILDLIDRLATVFPGVTAVIRTEILQKVTARLLVKMDTGFAVVEHHQPWVDARRPQIDPFYWSRFKLYMQKDSQWPPRVITAMDRSTDEILDLMGNPAESGTWKRRGLVMGDVQSGKTATYSALICKAADAGYRFIVLLTGTIENLRRQTQERLDAAFVGFDSSEQLKSNGLNLRVGVGKVDGQRQASVFTSSSADFKATTLEALGLSLHALSEPALVVIKKHAKILANLRTWLRSYNPSQNEGIEIPFLLIDDEADNASINTNDPGKNPTAVNEGIRELLKLFRRTTYVGFTATPFANIFVDPDTKESMLGDDLFPRDFIYTLESPTNYFGPRKIFLEDAGEGLYLRAISDVQGTLPARHKSDHSVTALPESLIDALCVFLVSNAIRDLRGEGATHRSMLVNISQFTRVQDAVEELLHAELGHLQTQIRSFSALSVARALEDPRIRRLHKAWDTEYSSCGYEWPAVQRALHNAALPVTTKAVNQRTGPGALDYRAHKDTGLRVVAVGGNSLSRGLTLEGLVVSYFSRSTQMYDTLLQMGRWFGFRPGYEDLCRVWLPKNAIDWYGHICNATEELRAELRRMSRLGKAPKDFGLAVRAHPDSLLVTAHNKMRTAAEVTRIISLSSQSFESVELPTSVEDLSRNFARVANFIATVSPRGEAAHPGSGRLFKRATRGEVAQLLRTFALPVTEFRFQPGAIAEMLENVTSEALAEWDVGIPSGDGTESVSIGGLEVRPQVRSIRRQDPPGVLVISGRNRRVGSRGVESMGLTEEQVAAARKTAWKAAEKKADEEGQPPPGRVNVADSFYRAERTRPLLLLHVLQGEPEDARTILPRLGDAALVAIGLSFPTLENEPDAREVKYKINLVRARELFSSSLDPGDDEEPEPEGS